MNVAGRVELSQALPVLALVTSVIDSAQRAHSNPPWDRRPTISLTTTSNVQELEATLMVPIPTPRVYHPMSRKNEQISKLSKQLTVRSIYSIQHILERYV